jgi:hypothetical protein
MARTFYDSLGINEDIELDLAMLEATGLLIHDESRNHSMATMHSAIGVPLWLQTATGQFGLFLNQAYPFLDMRHFIDIPAADCPNLDFTTTDYSLAMWFNWKFEGYSQIIMGKYVVSQRGWEAYLHNDGVNDSLTVRHHHGGTRTATYSLGWTQNVEHLWSYSRVGINAYHYRDGNPIAVVGGPLQDPNSNIADDFRIGCRYTEDANWFKARFHRPRVWSRALTADEHRLLYRLGKP